MKIFGISMVTILAIVLTAVVVQKFGDKIPLLNQIS